MLWIRGVTYGQLGRRLKHEFYDTELGWSRARRGIVSNELAHAGFRYAVFLNDFALFHLLMRLIS